MDATQQNKPSLGTAQPMPRRSSGSPGHRGGAAVPSGIVIAFCCVGVLGWAFYLWAFHSRPFQDWTVFYTAAKSYLDGNLALLFHGRAFTAALNHRFAAWFAAPLNLHPWVYPPPFLLLLLPFGAMPPALSLAVFMLAGFVAAVAAAWFCVGSSTQRGLLILSLCLCPAVPFNVMTGQNAFYSSALLLAGFGILERNPLAGGALLGLLSLKPQLALMVPVALVAARQWRALAAMIMTALVLALASVAVLGIHPWQVWLQFASGHGGLYRHWLKAGRLGGVSIFAYASFLGASRFMANVAQAAAVAIAAYFVHQTFSREAWREWRLAVLLAATMLAAPHASDSDAVLLGLAASLFIAMPRPARGSALGASLGVLVWISPLLNPPVWFPIGLATPILVLLFLAFITAVLARRTDPSRSVEWTPGSTPLPHQSSSQTERPA